MSADRVAMAAALYEAKIPCDSGEDVDRLMDILSRRGWVLTEARASQPLTLDVERLPEAAQHMYGVLNKMTAVDQRTAIGTFIAAINQALDEYGPVSE